MRSAHLVVALVATMVYTSFASAGFSDVAPPRVCEGLTICAPVGGPWVVVPGPTASTDLGGGLWQLRCPPALGIVGGVDVRVSNPWLDVYFPGRIGSPINPGVTTGNDVVFTAISFGPRGRTSSFVPFVGCIPSQGGQRIPTAFTAPAEFRRGAPLVRRVRTFEVRPGPTARSVLSCKPGERLVSAQTATGLHTALAPRPSQIRAVHVTHAVRGGKIFVTATRLGLARGVAVDVQIHALCAGGRFG